MTRTRSQTQRQKRRLETRKSKIVLGLCTFMVLVNAFWVGVRSQHLIRSELLRHGVSNSWSWAGLPQYSVASDEDVERAAESPVWAHPILDSFFTLLFLSEVALRIWLFRWEFFFGQRWKWNHFDVILVGITIVHWFVNDFLMKWCGLSVQRLPRSTFLRILRMPRVAIDLSHLECIHALQLMTESTLQSLTFSWVAFCVVISIIYLFAVVFVQGMIDCLEGKGAGHYDVDDLLMMSKYFGSVEISVMSLFQAISGGIDWIELMQPLNFTPWRYTILLFVYIFTLVFGVLNIVTSLFVECVSTVTKENYQERIRTELIAQRSWMEQLKKVFREADDDESGTLSWNQFSSLCNVPMMRAYFKSLEMNIAEAQEVFEYLDVRGEGEVSQEDFVNGCLLLRGESKSVDIAVMRSQFARSLQQLTDLVKKQQKDQQKLMAHVHSFTTAQKMWQGGVQKMVTQMSVSS